MHPVLPPFPPSTLLPTGDDPKASHLHTLSCFRDSPVAGKEKLCFPLELLGCPRQVQSQSRLSRVSSPS